MALAHEHSPEPDPSLVKRLKTSAASIETSSNGVQHTCQFAENVLDHTNIKRLNEDYSKSEPFKHAVIQQLFQQELLEKVKDECLSELSFTEKETDIYKVGCLNLSLFL